MFISIEAMSGGCCVGDTANVGESAGARFFGSGILPLTSTPLVVSSSIGCTPPPVMATAPLLRDADAVLEEETLSLCVEVALFSFGKEFSFRDPVNVYVGKAAPFLWVRGGAISHVTM